MMANKTEEKTKKIVKESRNNVESVIFSLSSFLFFCNLVLFLYNLSNPLGVDPDKCISEERLNDAILESELHARQDLQTELISAQLSIQKTITKLEDEKTALSDQLKELQKTRQTVNELKYKVEDLACGIITTSKYHNTRAKAVYETWGKRCGVLLFFDATSSKQLPMVVLPGSEEGTIINEKVFGMFSHMWKHHSDKKWFIKADDDTYLHFENIIDMLSEYDYNDKHYIGRAGEWGRGSNYVKYCGGGAGYIISQGALKEWSSHIPNCERLVPGEDVSVGKCLRDKIALSPTFKTGFYHKLPNFFITTAIGQRDHPEGLTMRPLSFHSVPHDTMYEVDYLCHFINQPLPLSGKWSDPWPAGYPTH